MKKIIQMSNIIYYMFFLQLGGFFIYQVNKIIEYPNMNIINKEINNSTKIIIILLSIYILLTLSVIYKYIFKSNNTFINFNNYKIIHYTLPYLKVIILGIVLLLINLEYIEYIPFFIVIYNTYTILNILYCIISKKLYKIDTKQYVYMIIFILTILSILSFNLYVCYLLFMNNKFCNFEFDEWYKLYIFIYEIVNILFNLIYLIIIDMTNTTYNEWKDYSFFSIFEQFVVSIALFIITEFNNISILFIYIYISFALSSNIAYQYYIKNIAEYNFEKIKPRLTINTIEENTELKSSA